MAVTSLWRIKGAIKRVIMYAEDKKKTEVIETNNDDRNSEQLLNDLVDYASRDDATQVKRYVSAINCSVDDTVNDMLRVKNFYNKPGGTVAYHGYLSFAKDEVSPDEAHQIGYELATKLWGDRYQVLVTTHLDKTSHIHCHFVLNTVSIIDGKKFFRSAKDYYDMQRCADALCREHGLSVIEYPNGRRQNYEEYMSEKNGQFTNSAIIKNDMNICMNAARTYDEFIKLMSKKGYVFDLSGKYEKITHPNFARPRRLITLGKEYTIGYIKETIRRNWQFEKEEYPPQDDTDELYAQRSSDDCDTYPSAICDTDVLHLRFLYARYTFEMSNWIDRKQYNKYKLYLIKDDIKKFNRFAEEQDVLLYNHINTGSDLLAYIEKCDKELSDLSDVRNKLRNKLKTAVANDKTEQITEIKSQIFAVTQAMKKVRREKTVCERIRDRAPEIKEKLDAVAQTNEKIRNEREVKTHESGRRISGRNRQDRS